MSLNNQANLRSETGDRAGALEAINEAVTLRRQLAAANPAAFTPNLAASLNNQANLRSETGDRAGALEAINEAVTLRRQLAAANPAAFTPDLAMSLNNQATLRSETGDRAGALEAIDQVLTDQSMSPWTTARIQATKGLWAHRAGDSATAVACVREAARLADAAPADDLQATPGRLAIRSLAQEIGDQHPEAGPDELPAWATAPFRTDANDLINRWKHIAFTAAEADFVGEHHQALATPDTSEQIALLAALYQPDPFLQRATAILDLLADTDPVTVAAELRDIHDITALLHDWMATRTWAESEQFLRKHLDQLGRPHARQILQAQPAPITAQHLAIITLADDRELSDVYDIVTSIDDAALAILDAIEANDSATVTVVAQANPNSVLNPRSPLALTSATLLLAILGNDVPADNVALLAAASDDERPLLRDRLTCIRDRRPDLADPIDRLLQALDRQHTDEKA
jgi:hypothetical protein